MDAARLLRPALERNAGRGGGSARMAQGSVGGPEALDQVMRDLLLALGRGEATDR
jgi:hypothetical protein